MADSISWQGIRRRMAGCVITELVENVMHGRGRERLNGREGGKGNKEGRLVCTGRGIERGKGNQGGQVCVYLKGGDGAQEGWR